MIASLSISKLALGLYGVHVDDADAGVVYESIAEAISEHSDIPPEYAKFVNIEYHSVRLATMHVSDMQSRSRELAADLVRMSAEIYASE
jgi:hypothetical protein